MAVVLNSIFEPLNYWIINQSKNQNLKDMVLVAMEQVMVVWVEVKLDLIYFIVTIL